MKLTKIVVWDPSGTHEEGSIPSDESLRALEAEGLVALPVDEAERYRLNAVSSYVRAVYGPGWRLTGEVGMYVCPLLLWHVPHRPFIHWAARLVPAGPSPSGSIRVVHNGAQPGAHFGGLSGSTSVSIAKLGAADINGGWTIGGSAHLAVTAEGYLGIALYGAAQDVAVKWVAATTFGGKVTSPFEQVGA